MSRKMTQEQRLDYLVEAFKADSEEYKDLQTPTDTEGKKRIFIEDFQQAGEIIVLINTDYEKAIRAVLEKKDDQ